MLMTEAELASRIEHPNVVSTLELGEQEQTLFLVMEWADGESLSHLLRQAVTIPLPVAVNIIAQACKGAHAAHELTDEDGNALGVVHRDISPQNVLVTYGGVVKVVDFGIAKATQRSSSLTEDGEVKGKLAYMSPEQGKGQTVDRRTDVFALGTMLYVLTTGRHPFKGETPGETLARLFAEVPLLPPRRFDPEYPEALEQVVLKCLSKNRARRYGTAQELLEALERALPEARGIEDKVAAFVRNVSAEHGEKRRQHIRAAGEMLDRRMLNVLAVGSATSLSAMSLGEPKPAEPAEPVLPRVSIPDFRPKVSLRSLLAGAAGVGMVVALLLHANRSPGPAASETATHAPPPLMSSAEPPLEGATTTPVLPPPAPTLVPSPELPSHRPMPGNEFARNSAVQDSFHTGRGWRCRTRPSGDHSG
jgi:serine/threonine-protein kinase